MTQDDAVSDLIARALEKRAEGGTAEELAEFCSAHPEHEKEISSALNFAGRLPILQRASIGSATWAGAVIDDRYRLDERLGSGAMGVVWSAVDQQLDRRVAIKLISAMTIDEDAATARVLREAGALAAIQHDAVVRIHDRGALPDGRPYLVMEQIDGVPLSTILEQTSDADGTFDRTRTSWIAERWNIDGLGEETLVRQAVRWVADLADGVVAAHDAGVTHRDIKPSNVMVRRDGRAILLDFGIATIEGSDALTRTDATIGTPAYMAPESVAGGTSDPMLRDVYGLAATLYHLITQRAPYVGSPPEILTALATREPTPAARLRAGLPRDLLAILDAGLGRRLKDRYSSVSALRRDLRAFLSHEPVSVRPVSPLRRGVRRLRQSRLAAGAAAALLIVGATLGWMQWSASKHAARIEAAGRAQAAIPANLTVVIPANRRPAEPVDRATILRQLDAYVESALVPVPALALRASFRLDVGDPTGAASDMARIADVLETPYSEQLAQLYVEIAESAPDSEPAAADLELARLPEPASALDYYLAGYHELRQLRREEALAFLSHEGLRDVRHARELAALCRLIGIDSLRGIDHRKARFVAAAQVVHEARQIEQDFGGPSAMTRHICSYGFGVQRLWAKAFQATQQAAALSECSLVIHQNAAQSARFIKNIEAVRRHSKAAIHLAPHYGRLYETWIYAEMSAGEVATARKLLDEAPITKKLTRFVLARQIDLTEAIAARGSGDQARAVELAEGVMQAIAAADPSGKSLTLAAIRRTAVGVAEDDKEKLFVGLLDELEKRYLSLNVLRDLNIEFPDVIPPEATPGIRNLLLSVEEMLIAGTLISADADASNNNL